MSTDRATGPPDPGGAGRPDRTDQRAGRRPPVFWSAAYEVDIGAHVYPTEKYRLVRERLLADGTVDEDDFVEPRPATRDELARIHDEAWLDKVEAGALSHREELKLEVPFSPELREAMTLACGGTTMALRRALDDGVAVHLGGGFHHGFADHGEGFCLLNDVAVAARAVLAEGRAERVAVVDLDVHQGNGTAAVFAGDDAVFTFSMHQERNYPFPKPPGDLDVGLGDGTRDEEYLELLEHHLPAILEDHRPDAVLYLAGADPFVEDQLGGLSLSRDGLRARDRTVLEGCARAGVPVAAVPAGGYAVRLRDTVAIHVATVEEAVAAA